MWALHMYHPEYRQDGIQSKILGSDASFNKWEILKIKWNLRI